MNTDDRMESIRERLTIARKQAGLSQSQVSKLMGFDSPSTISHIETGERELRMEIFLQLAEIYDVSEVWLLTGANPNFDIQAFWDAVGPVADDVREDMVSLCNLLETLRQVPT